MILEEYDEELHIQSEKEISYEDGVQAGVERGIEQTMLQVYQNCLNRGMTREDAVVISGITEAILKKAGMV